MQGILKKILTVSLCAAMISGAAASLPVIMPDSGIVASAVYTSGDYEYDVDNGSAVIKKYKGSATNLTIPSKLGGYTVTEIGNWAFEYCSSLTSVTIPSGVESVGMDVFGNCNNLTTINVDSANKSFSSKDGVLYSKSFDALVIFPCGKTSVTIPNTVKSIERYAFSWCRNIKSITLPNSLTSIADSAFTGCKGLTSITIPAGVTSIDASAFGWCENLTSINVDSSNKTYVSQSGILFDKNLKTLVCCPSGKTSASIPNSVTVIGEYAFLSCTNIKNITIPNSVTTIEGMAFFSCKSLTSIVIPNSITSIGFAAFDNCESLTSIVIPNSITSIKSSTFENCKSLTSVTIPNSIKTIDKSAFYGCDKLMSVTIPSSVTSIGNKAFGYHRDTNYSEVVISGFTINGTKGSAAETYANDNGIKFVSGSSTDVAVTGITLNKTSATVSTGSKLTLTATVKPSNATDKTVKWTTDKSYIASVSNGVVTGNSAGTATITAKTSNGKTATCKVTVVNPTVAVTGISLNKTSTTITKGSSQTLTATITPSNATDKTVKWTTSNSSVATVSGGKVTAVAAGTATITAKSNNGKTATCTVTVKAGTVLPVLNNTSVINSNKVQIGDKVRIAAAGNGGTGGYKYAYYYKRSTNAAWNTLGTEWGTNSSVAFAPTAEAKYNIKVVVKDSAGQTAEKLFTVTAVKELELTNVSVIGRENIKLGSAIPMIGKAVGGAGNYRYSFYFKRSTNTAYKLLGEKYTTNASARFKPTAKGTYDIRIDVMDKSGKVVKKYFTATVK